MTEKIPKTLIFLGLAIELITTNEKYIWKKKDKCDLFANENGTKLYILKMTQTEKQISEINISKKAKKLFERWSHNDVDKIDVMKLSNPDLNKNGRAKYIVYASDKFDGKMRQYIHVFKRPPIVWAQKTDSTAVVLTGGRIRITSGGITG